MAFADDPSSFLHRLILQSATSLSQTPIFCLGITFPFSPLFVFTSHCRRCNGQSFLPASEVFDHVLLHRAVASPLPAVAFFLHDRPEAKTQCWQDNLFYRFSFFSRWSPSPCGALSLINALGPWAWIGYQTDSGWFYQLDWSSWSS